MQNRCVHARIIFDPDYRESCAVLGDKFECSTKCEHADLVNINGVLETDNELPELVDGFGWSYRPIW